MIFEQQDRKDVIRIGEPHYSNTPAPEVGKIYKAFDDGKVKWSRLDYWRIDRAIDLDKGEADEELLEYLQDEINTCYWLYSKEQHVIYEATMVNEDGSEWHYKEDTEPTKCYFLYTQDHCWFGTGFLVAGLLDVDERYYKELVEYTNKHGD